MAATPPPKEPKAFAVSIADMTCIVFAIAKAQAQWIAVRDYWKAGYGTKRIWPRSSAVRRPELDGSPKRLEPPQAYTEEDV